MLAEASLKTSLNRERTLGKVTIFSDSSLMMEECSGEVLNSFETEFDSEDSETIRVREVEEVFVGTKADEK